MSEQPLGLVRYDAMRHAIAEAYSLDEVKDIRDRAVALETYARQAQNEEDEHRCREIRQRAENRAGEILREMKRDGELRHPAQGRPEKASQTVTLSKLRITRDQSSDWQKIAGLPRETFEQAIKDGVSTSDMVEMAKPKPPVTPVAQDALWVWGRLRDFERDGLLESDPIAITDTMTEPMRKDVERLAPLVAEWLGQILEERREPVGEAVAS